MSVRKRSSYICIYYKFSRPKRNVFMCITDRHISCNVEKINIQQFRDLFFLLSTGNYVLGYLASRPKLVHYVLQALVQVCIMWLIYPMTWNLSLYSIYIFYYYILKLWRGYFQNENPLLSFMLIWLILSSQCRYIYIYIDRYTI